jgi:hypothetical protein
VDEGESGGGIVRTDVVALFVDPRGPYPKLVAEWYDETRDALTYDGELPVVAHPPCGPWGRLRHMSKHDDPALAVAAVAIVRAVGGVLEHPADSLLFERCGMPKPGELPDTFGGRTLRINQSDWGHPARKPTWLYIVGRTTLPPFPAPREPTHWIGGGRGRVGKKHKTTPIPPGIKVASQQMRRRTPLALAVWLIEVAAACTVLRRSA